MSKLKNLSIIFVAIMMIFIIGNVQANSENMSQDLKVLILPRVDIISPQQNAIYESRQILINLSANGPYRIQYSDNGKKPVIICNGNCNMYHSKRLFDDGIHNLTFFASYNGFGIKIVRVNNVIISSKKPIITDIMPKEGFTDGNFTVKFQDANPVSLILEYGNKNTGYRNASLDLNNCSNERLTKICNIQVNLVNYNQQNITYLFYLRNVVNKETTSKIKNLKVDFNNPIINLLNYTISKNKVTFNVNVSDINFDKVLYFDNYDSKPKFLNVWKTLCSKLTKDNLCIQSRFFTKGHHTVNIKVTDKAGNYENKTIDFDINYP